MKWMNVERDRLFCPKCHSDEISFKRVEPPKGFKSLSSDSHYLYKCCACHWRGDPMSLLEKDEFKNIRRTELIDAVLK